MKPGYERARQSLIQLLYVSKRYDELLRVCEEGIRLDPNQGFYPFFMGKAYVEKGMVPEALAAFERCRKLGAPPAVLKEMDELEKSMSSPGSGERPGS
jgi:tetratricopeptide (TPR) repeat protein